jgi:DNA-binding Lrp family transcriptional regulator
VSRELTKVRRAAHKAARARQELDAAIREAHGAGLPLRAIATEAGLSPEWVRRIASKTPPPAR